MLRVITALVATVAAVVTLGATATPSAAPKEVPSNTVVAGGNHWCC